MFNLGLSLFSVILTSYVLSKYFFQSNLDSNLKYKRKGSLSISLGISWLSIVFFYIGYCLNSMLISNISFLFLFLVGLKEIVICVMKINYYDEKLKLISSNNDYTINRDIIKKKMVIDYVKDIFYCLGIPFLILEYLIKRFLDIIFKW